MLLPWYAVELCNSYASTLLTYCAYFLAERVLNADTTARLWLSATWGISYVFFALLAGKLTSRWGPRTLMIRGAAASVITAASGVLVLITHSYWMLVLTLMLYNFTCTQVWPALETAITRTPARMSLSHRMTLYNLVWSAGNFTAMCTADIVMHISPYAAFLLPAFFTGMAALIGAIYTLPASMLSTNATHHHEHDATTPPYAGRLLLMAWVANAMAYVAINTLLPSMPAITGHLAKGYASSGSLWSLARVAGFILFAGWAGWHYRRRYLIGSVLLMTVMFIALMSWPVLPVFILAQFAFGLMTAFVYASSLYYAMHVSHGSGGHAGLHEALIGVGIAIGPTVGALAGTGSESLPKVAFWVTGVLLIGVASLLLLSRRTPAAEPLQSLA